MRIGRLDYAARIGSATWYAWFASFLLNASVSRVNRFCYSTYDVLMCFGFGSPVTRSMIFINDTL